MFNCSYVNRRDVSLLDVPGFAYGTCLLIGVDREEEDIVAVQDEIVTPHNSSKSQVVNAMATLDDE